MDEFDFIDRLRPLATSAEARGLSDDAAVVPARPGFDLVLSKDAIVEGVHFLTDDPLDLVARKLLRVNLSDLAAKGAAPYGYLLAVAWPARCDEAERTAFLRGLATDQAVYGLTLLGGDTVSTPGPLTASCTILGWVPSGTAVARSGARAGDLVMVTGTIGDGWLGLQAAQGRLPLDADALARLADRYRLPQPRTAFAETVRSRANASADVSDGLVADAGHIAAASSVAITLDLEAMPLSPDATVWLSGQAVEAAARLALATGGDDYEIVFTAPAPVAGATVIGRVEAGQGIGVRWRGETLFVGTGGWRH